MPERYGARSEILYLADVNMTEDCTSDSVVSSPLPQFWLIPTIKNLFGMGSHVQRATLRCVEVRHAGPLLDISWRSRNSL